MSYEIPKHDPTETLPPAGKAIGACLVIAGILAGMFVASRYSYTLFHSLAELFVIVTASAIFAIAWNSRAYLRSNYYSIISVAFASTAVLLVAHMLAYKGMGVFEFGGVNLPTQLWIASRYILVTGFIVAPFLAERHPAPVITVVVFAALTAALGGTIFAGYFPVAYIEGVGLTGFKVASEYAVSGLFLVALALLWRHKATFDKEVFWLTAASIGFLAFTDIALTLYVDPYGISNLTGHFLQIIAFFLIYTALIRRVLVNPYSMILRELKAHELALHELAITDSLTGLFNFRYFQEQLEHEISRAERYGHALSLLMIDIDDFKNLNDTCGHQAGDDALAAIAADIKDGLRAIDIPARYGGEEFVVILPETDGDVASQVAERIRAKIHKDEFCEGNECWPYKLTVSIGVAEFPTCADAATALIRASDIAMYASKESGKNRVTIACAAAL